MLARRKEEFALYEEEEAMLDSVVITKPKVAAQPRVNKKLRAQCAIFIVLFAVLAMFTTVRSETIVSEGYALVQTKSDAAKLEQENERLKLEIAQLKSPQRIQQFAAANLGMIVPPEVYFASKSGE